MGYSEAGFSDMGLPISPSATSALIPYSRCSPFDPSPDSFESSATRFPLIITVLFSGKIACGAPYGTGSGLTVGNHVETASHSSRLATVDGIRFCWPQYRNASIGPHKPISSRRVSRLRALQSVASVASVLAAVDRLDASDAQLSQICQRIDPPNGMFSNASVMRQWTMLGLTLIPIDSYTVTTIVDRRDIYTT